MAFALHALRPNSHFVDVGANVGTYSVLAGGVVGASCIALEPVPNTYKHLSDNIRLNDLCDQVECRNAGVGASEDTLRFTTGKGAENRVLRKEVDGGVEIPVTTLDAICNRIGKTDSVLMIKVDVEGWETAVLEGGQTVVSRTAPTALLLELNGSGTKYGFDENDTHRNLLDLGYTPVRYDPFSRRITRRSHRQSGGNTLYLNSVEIFEDRVGQSPSYSVLDRQI